MNKKVLILVIALAVVAAGAVVYFKVADRSGSGGDNLLVPMAAADVYETDNRLEVIQGVATVIRASGEEEEIADETTVDVGDTIKVSAEGRATLYWFDHSISRLAGGTELTIDQAAYNPENVNETDVSFEVISGEVWSKVQAIVDEDSEFLGYAGNVVAGVRGSVFNLAVDGDEVVVESIAHALTVGDETLTSGQGAGFDKESGRNKFKEDISEDTWSRLWFMDNLDMDKADQQRMMAVMMEKLRRSIGALPGEPEFTDKMEALEAFMESDASPARKRAVKAKLVALVRAMDILPDHKLYPVKVMLRKKLIEWEDSNARREFMMRKRLEARLFTLQDWITTGEPTPEELKSYLRQFRELLGEDSEFFDKNPELVGAVRKIMQLLEEKMPSMMEDAMFLRIASHMEEVSDEAPAGRSAPVRSGSSSIELLDVSAEEPPVTTEPAAVIEEEAPYYRGESNV